MNQDLKNTIRERLNKLPPDVVAAITNVSWVEKIQDIAKGNKLDEERGELFWTETMLVVLGIESPEKYPINLAANVRLDDGTVIKIAKEVDEQIITPILSAIERVKQKPLEKDVSEIKSNLPTSTTLPEIPPTNLPMIEKGEEAHTVPQKKSKSLTEVPLPDYRYEGGDPYREPLK